MSAWGRGRGRGRAGSRTRVPDEEAVRDAEVLQAGGAPRQGAHRRVRHLRGPPPACLTLLCRTCTCSAERKQHAAHPSNDAGACAQNQKAREPRFRSPPMEWSVAQQAGTLRQAVRLRAARCGRRAQAATPLSDRRYSAFRLRLCSCGSAVTTFFTPPSVTCQGHGLGLSKGWMQRACSRALVCMTRSAAGCDR